MLVFQPQVASCRATFLPKFMNATELVEHLVAAGAKPFPSPEGSTAAVTVGCHLSQKRATAPPNVEGPNQGRRNSPAGIGR